MKKKVLILAPYYTPSIKGGGPIISVKNIIENLSNKIDFFVITSDRDFGDNTAFDNIETDKWLSVGDANVFYTNTQSLTWNKLKAIVNSQEFDWLYVNSFFSLKFSILPVLLKLFKQIQIENILIAPRGEFSPGALKLKTKKKKIYIELAKLLGLYKNVRWHATTKIEKRYIINNMGDNNNIFVANNLTENYNRLVFDKKIAKKTGELKIIFISRVHPKKNLQMAIEYLENINGEIVFDIYGPIEDERYWAYCLASIKKLPRNIKVEYKGILKHKEIIPTLKKYHVFLFPTLGENFGHVISEALIGGCPVIISDQTPWRNLNDCKAGWDIPLSNKLGFVECIQKCVNLNENEYKKYSVNAFEYGTSMSNKIEDIEDSIELFKN